MMTRPVLRSLARSSWLALGCLGALTGCGDKGQASPPAEERAVSSAAATATMNRAKGVAGEMEQGGDGRGAPAAAMPMASAYAGAERKYGKLSQGAKGAIATDEDPSAAGMPIDPNGRFATTYRPGGGHLAAFESAITRGLLLPTDREIVSDIGAAYSGSITKPKDKAINVAAAFERSALGPNGGEVHVRIDLQSTESQPVDRPKLSVVVVLDTSGSMKGELIDSARKAAISLVDRLDANDQFSLVTFSTAALVNIKMEQVGPNRDAIKKTIEGLQEGGGTNISEGLKRGYEELHSKVVPDEAQRVTFLLSDGRANNGITNQVQLAQLANDAFQDGIQTSSFGLGSDYDGPLMAQIAEEGAGGYYYLRDPAQIAPALSTELDKRLAPVATALEVRVRLKPGVDLMSVYGSRKLDEREAAVIRNIEVAQDKQGAKSGIEQNRQDDQQGGMRFFIPAFARDESHGILLKLRLPAGVNEKDVGLVEVKYKDRVTKKNVSDEVPLKIKYATSDADSAKTIDVSVQRTVQGFAAGQTLLEAARLVSQGRSKEAATLLVEREDILKQASTTLSEPLFEKDALRLARLRSRIDDTSADPLVVAMMVQTAGNTRLR